MLIPFNTHVSTWSRPHYVGGLQIGSRMTLVRLRSGLFVHSPLAPDAEMQESIGREGRVKHIVAPSLYHSMHTDAFASAYPDARVYGPRGLPEKRPALGDVQIIDNGMEYPWSGEVAHHVVGGLPALQEVVFLHRATGTLILTDLLFNVGANRPVLTRLFFWLTGGYNRPAPSVLLRRIFLKDRQALRNSLRVILEWDFEKIALCHGNNVTHDGHRLFREAFAFLLGDSHGD